ncbi:CapA family protein [Blastococcus montanus]|uniref:CapA family protein n=1 Tax=Blastococcus montanus TaxID=3144973 RepID=UPI00320AE7CF
MTATDELTIVGTGDLVLGIPHADRLFGACAEHLRAADVAVGHVEVPHTDTPDLQGRPGLPTERLDVLRDVGIGVATLAGNHVYDCGASGIAETRAALEARGILPVGAGPDLEAARRPVTVERRGRRIGFLSYNAVGPTSTWATDSKAGCAYVRILTAYELDYASPGAQPEVFTVAEPRSLWAMQGDVARLGDEVDVVVVSFHKGLVHVPATLATYEVQLGRAAIDAGAHVVLGHHGHVTQGIELYRDRPIYHGLGNFVTVTPVLSTRHEGGKDSWAQRRLELFGFQPDPRMPDYYAFHPESRHTMLASVRVAPDGRVEAGFLPCWIDETAQPVPAEGELARTVVDYIRRSGERAGLSTTYAHRDGRVVAG